MYMFIVFKFYIIDLMVSMATVNNLYASDTSLVAMVTIMRRLFSFRMALCQDAVVMVTLIKLVRVHVPNKIFRIQCRCTHKIAIQIRA